jgi:beta propeller repeat protein
MTRLCGTTGWVLLINLAFAGAAAMAQPFAAFQISNDPESSITPQTDGRFVVWQSVPYPLGGGSVLGYDLLTAQLLAIPPGGFAPALSDGILVKEYIGLQGQNLLTGEEFSVSDSGSRPRISSNLVVWDAMGSSNEEVLGRRLDQPGATAFPISAGKPFDQYGADVDGNIVVWAAADPANPGSMYGRDLSGGEIFPITSSGFATPRISGRYVVWQDLREGLSRIYAKDLVSGSEFPVSPVGKSGEMPAIDGDLVVWRQYNPIGDQSDIWGRFLSEGDAFQITDTAVIWESQPEVHGNLVVWEQGITGTDMDVWGAVVPEPTAAALMLMGMALLSRRRGRRQ